MEGRCQLEQLCKSDHRRVKRRKNERSNYGNFWHRKRGGYHRHHLPRGAGGQGQQHERQVDPHPVRGAVSYYLAPIPDFPAGDPITAIAVGIVSGLAATGINQAVKQLSKGE